MRSPLAATFDLMLEFSRAVCLEDVYDVLLSRSAKFGVTSVLAGLIPKTIVRPSEQPGYVILGHWPAEWAERYFHKQYVRRDPTILHCAHRDEPLFWSELHYADDRDPARRIMDEAREFKLLDGLTIPQFTIDGHRIGISYSGEKLDKSPRAVTELTVLATYAVARALQLRATADAVPVHLTPRERECLLWTSEGKTSDDTGTILGVTAKAVEKHLLSVRTKLNAISTTHAVTQALRLGLL